LGYDLIVPFTMHVNYADYTGTFHRATCPHSTNRKTEDTENGAWFDGITSEAIASGLLEFVRRTKLKSGRTSTFFGVAQTVNQSRRPKSRCLEAALFEGIEPVAVGKGKKGSAATSA